MPHTEHHWQASDHSQLSALLRQGLSLSASALQLERDKPTLSREIQHNSGPDCDRDEQAQWRVEERRQQASARLRKVHKPAWDRIGRLLLRHLSAGYLAFCKAVSVSPFWTHRLGQRDRTAGRTDYFWLRQRQLAAKTRDEPMGCASISKRRGLGESPALVASQGRVGDWKANTQSSARATKGPQLRSSGPGRMYLSAKVATYKTVALIGGVYL